MSTTLPYSAEELKIVRAGIDGGMSVDDVCEKLREVSRRDISLTGVYEKMRRIRRALREKDAAKFLAKPASPAPAISAPKPVFVALPPAAPEPVLPLRPCRPRGWDEGFSMLRNNKSERAGSAHGAAIGAAPSF